MKVLIGRTFMRMVKPGDPIWNRRKLVPRPPTPLATQEQAAAADEGTPTLSPPSLFHQGDEK